VDWGSKSATTGSGSLVSKVDALLSRYQPDVLVLEDLAAKGARRRVRARRGIGAIERLAFTRGVRVERVSRLAVRNTFAPGKSKYDVALRLAEIYPAPANRLPEEAQDLDAGGDTHERLRCARYRGSGGGAGAATSLPNHEVYVRFIVDRSVTRLFSGETVKL
jgi:hypothetical protein